MCNAFIDRMELKNYSVFSAWFNWFEEREFISCIRLVQFFSTFSFLFICWDALPRWKGIIRLNLVGNQHSNFARIQACSKSKREFFVFVWIRILFFCVPLRKNLWQIFTLFEKVLQYQRNRSQNATVHNLRSCLCNKVIPSKDIQFGSRIPSNFFCKLFLLIYLHRKENLWLCEAFSSST